jgi:GNAT superfamily N-acetyltransferase
MPAISYQRLPCVLLPLANKFYKGQGSNMRAGRNEQVWVARQGELVAACCLKPQEPGHWLTALLVAEQHRQQGIARALLETLRRDTRGPIWLFCHPHLLGFYQRLGFQPASILPPALAQRLQRYQHRQALQALISDTQDD